MKESDEKFVQDAKGLFDTSVDELDGATLSTLNHGRHRALAEMHSPRAEWLRWMPAAGVATVVLVAVMVWLPGPGDVEVAPTTVTDMEILLDEDSLEMFEDLEFYSWIDEADEGNGVG